MSGRDHHGTSAGPKFDPALGHDPAKLHINFEQLVSLTRNDVQVSMSNGPENSSRSRGGHEVEKDACRSFLRFRG